MKKTIKGWVILDAKNDRYTGQVTTIMSQALVDFYNRSDFMKCVPCTITYSPNKKVK